MAGTITVTQSLAYSNTNPAIQQQSLNISGLNVTMTSTTGNFVSGTMSVPTTAGGTVIPVGNLANIGWVQFKNIDATNFIELYNAVSGTKFAKLFPGEGCQLRVDPAIVAPAALANTAIASLQYLMMEI